MLATPLRLHVQVACCANAIPQEAGSRSLSSRWNGTFLTLSRVIKSSSPFLAGIFNCGSTIIREEGARSLWKGLTPFAGNLTLKYFLRFGTNGLYQNLLRDQASRCAPHFSHS